jgi:SP family sugar:H+ symporter-like MFS transporter
MSDFQRRFGDGHEFDAVRAGTIVALLAAGTLIGCLASGWIVDRIGRRNTISSSSFFYIAGVLIEITSMSSWPQFAMGRFTAGLGIGAISTSVPMYQAESIPKRFRSVVGASFQLMITFGIFLAYIVSRLQSHPALAG